MSGNKSLKVGKSIANVLRKEDSPKRLRILRVRLKARYSVIRDDLL